MKIEDLTKLPDADLYELCVRGDEAAWRYLYWFVLRIASWSRWNLGSSSEDLAQNVILSLIEKGLKLIKDKSSFRAFVKRTAINRVLDHLRALKHRENSLNFIPHLHTNSDYAEKKLLTQEAMEIIDGMLKDLPGYCHEVMRLYIDYQAGLVASYEQMANLLKRSINTISVQIKRCLDGFRNHRDFQTLRDYL